MIGPYAEEEEKGLDVIEEKLVIEGVPFWRMMKMYAELLRGCILAGRFDKAAPLAQLGFVAEHLQSAIVVLGTDNSDELRMPSRLELWSLSDRF